MVKLGVAGVGGRMGIMILKEIESRSDTVIASGLVRSAKSLVGSDLGTIASRECVGVAATDNAKQCFADADVVIDFSSRFEAIEEIAGAAIDAKKQRVVGTTGLDERQEAILRTASHEVPVVFASNMSLGVNLLLH